MKKYLYLYILFISWSNFSFAMMDYDLPDDISSEESQTDSRVRGRDEFQTPNEDSSPDKKRMCHDIFQVVDKPIEHDIFPDKPKEYSSIAKSSSFEWEWEFELAIKAFDYTAFTSRNEAGLTPLLLVIKRSESRKTQILLKCISRKFRNGINTETEEINTILSAQDTKDGLTPFHWATYLACTSDVVPQYTTRTFRILFGKKMCNRFLNVKDRNSRTPLDIALDLYSKSGSNNSKEICIFLVKKGAKFTENYRRVRVYNSVKEEIRRENEMFESVTFGSRQQDKITVPANPQRRRLIPSNAQCENKIQQALAKI